MRKKKESISRVKALSLIEDTKGRYFTAVYVKKDGTEREINCKCVKDQVNKNLGYILVKDEKLRKKDPDNCIRNVNMQTLKSITTGGKTYRVK